LARLKIESDLPCPTPQQAAGLALAVAVQISYTFKHPLERIDSIILKVTNEAL